MTIGTLALTGFNFTAGYYSKDAILFAAFNNGSEAGMLAFAIGIFVALLTSFYSWRLVFLTFYGAPRWDGHSPHESPWTMLVPLALLSVGALFAGWAFHHGFLGVPGFWNGAISHSAALYERLESVPVWVEWAPFSVMVIGFAIAWRNYIADPQAPARFVQQWYVLHNFLTHKWYFDELYDAIFVRPAKWLGRQFWQRGDVRTIDRFGPDGAAALVLAGSGAARRLQTGLVYSYALVMLLGVAAAATWMMVR
jgi:NADH-quinone oxidoreductase subunit L